MMNAEDKLKNLVELALLVVNEQKKANLELDEALPKLVKVLEYSWVSKLDELRSSIDS